MIKKIFFIIILLIIFILSIVFWLSLGKESIEEPKLEESTKETEEIKNEGIIDDTENLKKDNIENTEKSTPIVGDLDDMPDNLLPESVKIDVPFTSQAPYAVWDERHEEACEEASLLMMAKYLENEKLTPEISEKGLQDMIDFQIKKYGDYKDSDMKEVVKLAKDFYEIENLKVIYDFEKERMKEELAKGNPIIVPTAGRLLKNPYFTPPGPLYHNLVLIGYSGDTIITNDPGTKRGEGYEYDIDILYDAIHDFTGKKENIEKGRKSMIIIVGK